MARVVTTFPAASEFQKALARLEELKLPYEAIPASPGYARVGAGAVILDAEARHVLEQPEVNIITSGWVDWYEEPHLVPKGSPREFAEAVFESCAIMVLAPCVADRTKIRLTAHLSGDLAPVFPYMNAEMPHASYNPHGPNFTFMDGYRMIALYPRRVTIARADGIIDAWRVLEGLRVLANTTWARRAEIEPNYQMRERPPAIEIFKRLPRTNCGACGEATCLAFATKVWLGIRKPSQCVPVFGSERADLRAALLDICTALGAAENTLRSMKGVGL